MGVHGLLAHAIDRIFQDLLGAFADLIAAGKIRTLGASNFTTARLAEANTLAATNGLPRYEVLHVWGDGAHSDQHGGALLPDILRWLWPVPRR